MNLLDFQRPGRYLGKEWNLPFSKPKPNDYRICLCFPELYEVGMSNLGFRIIYQYINSLPGFSCERCFLPGKDLEKHLSGNKIPLFSLETKTPLSEFETTAFSINCEINMLNFLKMLHLSKIRLKANQRNQKPLIIVGGLNNPEPIADFVDLFFLGEAEDKLTPLCETLKKTCSQPKEERLQEISRIDGIYVPGFYTQENNRLIKNHPQAKLPLARVYVKDLNTSFYPSKWIVPYIPIVFDRLQIEIQRGCPHHCNFCQARKTYFPYREKKVSSVINQALSLYKDTGYEAVSFTGLSVMSYSKIEELLKETIPYFKKKRVTLSIPSIRPNQKSARIIEMLNYAKRPTLTIALETGTDPLRKCAGKDINIEDCFSLVKVVAGLGYKNLKFYFMIGLPEETIEDVIAIGQTLEDISGVYKKERGTNPQITATVSCFIPKPFSGFQNQSFLNRDSFQEKQSALRKRIARSKNIKLNFGNFADAFTECLLSRGNRSLTPVIEDIIQLHLNNDMPLFNYTEWLSACKRHSLDTDLFTSSDKTLPKHINPGNS